jgi:hypothetical protein
MLDISSEIYATISCSACRIQITETRVQAIRFIFNDEPQIWKSVEFISNPNNVNILKGSVNKKRASQKSSAQCEYTG